MAKFNRSHDSTMGKVQIVQRYVQQTIRDVRDRWITGTSTEYDRGWREACEACLEAFTDPVVVEDVLSARGPSDQLPTSGSDRGERQG